MAETATKRSPTLVPCFRSSHQAAAPSTCCRQANFRRRGHVVARRDTSCPRRHTWATPSSKLRSRRTALRRNYTVASVFHGLNARRRRCGSRQSVTEHPALDWHRNDACGDIILNIHEWQLLDLFLFSSPPPPTDWHSRHCNASVPRTSTLRKPDLYIMSVILMSKGRKLRKRLVKTLRTYTRVCITLCSPPELWYIGLLRTNRIVSYSDDLFHALFFAFSDNFSKNIA